MPVCTRCHKDWPEQYWVCPEDGTVLTAARAMGDGVLQTPVGIPREEDLAPGTMIGEYRVEGKLGEGGTATVFSATQPLIGKKVAIKVISRRLCADLHAVERFIGEARTVNQIQHPNLVDIFAFGVLPDGRAYLVMEWLQGSTLQELLSKQRLPPPKALEVLLQIVEALEAAHEKGVVHRDLKPANIFLVERKGGELTVKLLDFGIAKLADSDASVPKTRSGVAMGTAGYMSPEQARGKNVDHRTDIYALGCVAYETLLGQVPFVADTAIDILAMHLAAAPPPPKMLWAQIPPTLSEVLLGMLAKAPDERPTLARVRTTLQAALQSITPTMGIVVGEDVVARRKRRRWARGLVLGGASAATVMGGGLLLWRLVGPLAMPDAANAPAPPPVQEPAAPKQAAPSKPAELAGPPPVVSVPAAERADREKTGTLVVHAPIGAAVRIDAREVTVGPDGMVRAAVAADVEHQVTVRVPHRPAVTERMRVAPGATAELRAHAHGVRTVEKSTDRNTPETPEKNDNSVQKSNSGDYTLDPF